MTIEADLTPEAVYERVVDHYLDSEARYDPTYSGRGMYGKTTPAIITDDSLSTVNQYIYRAVADIMPSDTSIEAFLDTAEDLLLHRQDSMGRSANVYY